MPKNSLFSCSWMRVVWALGLCLYGATGPEDAASLLDDREAIERGYYAHRLGENPPFEETLTREGLRRSVERDLIPAPAAVVHDLTPFHDAKRVLVNPHKGWYHHFPDNHIDKYKIARDADLLEFPGMDHLYLRLAWAYLEPKEGQFDWAVIDRIIEKWTAHGLGIAFRISCKETSTDRIEQQFATPRWVMEAGAKGGYYRMGNPTGPEGPWEPVFDDPVFLAKLDRFLAAFAARYDHQPWLRYLDVGSIGDWGEGHSWAGSRQECGLEARKQHVDLHLKHFKHAALVVSDDFVYALRNPDERQALHQYVLTNGISYRDDSILVNGYLEGLSDSFTVRSPEFFADAFPNTPTVFELEHYSAVKRLGNWEGRPDSLLAKHGGGKKGPDFFRGALRLLHATYIGYHGYAHEWLADNPALTGELLNFSGYWLFPKSIELPEKLVAGVPVPVALTMENRGAAPPYAPYELRVRLSGAGTNWVDVLAKGCRSWMPDAPVASRYELPLPPNLTPGPCELSLGLFDVSSGKDRPVEFALSASLRDRNGYYRVATVPVVAAPSGPDPGESPAADSYVDSRTGDDARDGSTQDTAWRTLDKVNVATFKSGDRVLFRSGSVWSGQLRITARGEPGRPIVFRAYGEGPRPRIETAGAFEDAILIRNAQHLEVRDLELSNRGEGDQPRRGVHLVADNSGTLTNVLIAGLFIHDVNGTQRKKDNGGIIFRTRGERVPSRYHGLRIERNILWRVDRSGIAAQSYHAPRTRWFPSTNVLIRDNWVGEVGGDGIVPWATDGCLVEHNIVQGANERAGTFNAGIWPWSTDNTRMRLNRASGVKTLLDGQGFDSDYNSRNTIIEFNLSHDNEGGFLLICTPGKRKPEENWGNQGTIARFNISRHDCTRTFHVSAAQNTVIHDNAIYIGPGSDVQAVLLTDWSGWAKGLEFRDNLFHSEGLARYGHEVSRTKDGAYSIAPGRGPAQDVVFSGNRYFGQHENRPEESGVASTTSPQPIQFNDWPGPQFNPRQPEKFDDYLKAHREWMLRLMERQFGKLWPMGSDLDF